LQYLAQESEFHSTKENNTRSLTDFDSIFSDTVNEWSSRDKNRNELVLTKLLCAKLEGESGNLGLHSVSETSVNCSDDEDGKGSLPRIDLLLISDSKGSTSQVASTPVAVLEVGREHSLWWQKLDQNMKYIDNLGANQKDARLGYEQPVLSIVLTIEGDEAKADWDVKLGGFLCESREVGDRIMLLWHIHAKTLDEASLAFGNVLRATSDFRRWRECDAKSGTVDYDYFGPNCYRIGDWVSGCPKIDNR
jgi:hypothetical protein